jgi:hypothetical protein
MLSSDNNQNKNPEKEYNQTRPRSLASSGSELDAVCPEIEQSAVPGLVDGYKGDIPEASATKIINERKS